MSRWLWWMVSAAAGVGLGWVAMRSASWSEVLAALKGFDWRMLILALGAVFFAGFMEAIRWKLLLPREKVSPARLFLVRNAGNGLNNISPVRLLAEITQTTMLRYGDGIRIEKVVSSLIMSRLFDTLITMSLVGVGLIVLPQLAGLRPVVLPLWGLTFASIIAFVTLSRHARRVPALHHFSAIRNLLDSLNALTINRRAVLISIALTSITWMSIGTAAWLVASAAGIDLPFWLMSIVIVAVTLFTGMVPAPPGAVGVYEFGVISTLGLFAVDPSAALNFALVIHGVLFLPPIVIAIAVLAGDRKTLRRVFRAAASAASSRRLRVEMATDLRENSSLH